jgi:O-acetyl-ADP-ribose deacetylase (regulator of RNase III)
MLHEVTGDILKSKAAAIVHGVAPNDPFHSGLALQIRERFPAMYKDFRHYCQTNHPKPGEIWDWSGAGPQGGGPVRLVALLTQEGGYEHGAKPGGANLNHVRHALKALHQWIEREKPASMAMPRLATGVGGLEWKDVQPLIQQHLGGLKMPVYLYTTYHKDMQAEERVGAAARV